MSALSEPVKHDGNGLNGDDVISGGEWESGRGDDEDRSLDLASARLTAALRLMTFLF
jgi:hypothetical protein